MNSTANIIDLRINKLIQLKKRVVKQTLKERNQLEFHLYRLKVLSINNEIRSLKTIKKAPAKEEL